MTEKRSFHLISLGCPKNLVDSQGLAALLERAGYTATDVPAMADLLIVNTCGFIAPAREESVAVLQALAQAKRPGQRIIAAGCYSQRSPHELAQAVPEIDGFIGTRRWMDIVPLMKQLHPGCPSSPPNAAEDVGEKARKNQGPIFHTPETLAAGTDEHNVPRVAVQGASAYLKLADGCRRSCAFCAIPLIKGPVVSRSPEAILADVELLAEHGVQEIILIAQDTTDYGHDLGMRNGLAWLLEQMTLTVPQVPWIRLMYAYPGRVTDQLIETMARHPQILPYLDIPLQHAHPDVLRRMRRPADVEGMRHTVERLRAAMPDIAIRTTFIVGYPGETETEFQALLDFVAQLTFERVGVFTYFHEEGTPAANLEDDVPPEVKRERRARLMEIQQPISLARNQAWVGRTLNVLIEGQDEGLSVGRSFRDAPEIDGLVLVQAELPVGKIFPVHITAALEYDLFGEPLEAEIGGAGRSPDPEAEIPTATRLGGPSASPGS